MVNVNTSDNQESVPLGDTSMQVTDVTAATTSQSQELFLVPTEGEFHYF